MLCFLLGVIILFLISAGRWRVQSWPSFSEEKASYFEPWRVKIGDRIFWSADAAMFIGFGVVFMGLLLFLAFSGLFS
jgi:hypothetical protein